MKPSTFTLLRIALASVLLAFLTHTRADPDLWGHVLFGRDMVLGGSIVHADSYSFLADRPWINHEWLSECTMYLAYALGANPGLVLLKLTLLLIMLSGVWRALTRRNIRGRERDLLIACVALGAFPQFNHMRPQVFSLALFPWVLVALRETRTTCYAAAASIPLLLALWVNLHGGWIVGAGVLAMWTVCTIASPGPAREKFLLPSVGALALLATLANPYGWHMWSFLWSTVGFGRAEISDWQPVFRIGTAFTVIWLALSVAATAAIVVAWSEKPKRIHSIAIVAMLCVASFWVNRLLAFFAIATVALLGAEMITAWGRLRKARTSETAETRGWAAAAAVVIAIGIMMTAGLVAADNASCVRVDSSIMPEAEVVDVVAQKHLEGRLAVWFDWGEYAIWHMSPGVLVSIDGRRETVYSDTVLQRHLQFYYLPSSFAQFLEHADPDLIWLPSHLPVLRTLQESGWTTVFSGPRSVLLAKGNNPQTSVPASSVARCFPGP
jgi:hypothetical protein